MVKSPPCNPRDTGSIPGPGRSHLPQDNEARAPNYRACARDLGAAITEAQAPGAYATRQEEPLQWEAQPTAGGGCTQRRSPHSKHQPSHSQHAKMPLGVSVAAVSSAGSAWTPLSTSGAWVGWSPLAFPRSLHLAFGTPCAPGLPPFAPSESPVRWGRGAGGQTWSSFHSLLWWSRLVSRNTVHVLTMARLTARSARPSQTP